MFLLEFNPISPKQRTQGQKRKTGVEGGQNRKKERKSRNSFSFRSYFLCTSLLLKKKTDIGCSFISYSQDLANLMSMSYHLRHCFKHFLLVTGSQQYCKKSVLAGKARLFSNRKQETETGKGQPNGEEKKIN